MNNKEIVDVRKVKSEFCRLCDLKLTKWEKENHMDICNDCANKF